MGTCNRAVGCCFQVAEILKTKAPPRKAGSSFFMWQTILSAFSSLMEFIKSFRRSEEVRKERAEQKAPVFAQKQRKKLFNRAWDFVRLKKRIERKAKRKQLEDELINELNQSNDNRNN